MVHPPKYDWAFPTQTGAHDGDRGYFVANGFQVEGEGRDMVVIEMVVVFAATEGSPVAAWRVTKDEGTMCMRHPSAVHEDAAGFVVRVGPSGGPWESRLFHAPLDEIGSVEEPVIVLPGTPEILVVSPSTAALENRAAGRIILVSSGVVREMENLPGKLAGFPTGIDLVQDHAMWEEWGSGIRVAHGSPDDPTSVFIAVEGADVMSFSTDGVDMAWVQGFGLSKDGKSYERVELWTAPYVEDPDDLEARKVADLPYHVTYGKVGARYFAHYGVEAVDGEDRHIMVFYDLRDGTQLRFRFAEPNDFTSPPLYITSEVFAFSGGDFGDERSWLYEVEMASLVVAE